MRNIIYIVIGVFILCSSANNSYGQFWKKKETGATSTTPKKSDSFTGKSKKGPNVYSSSPLRTKSKSKQYSHSISRKKLQKKDKSAFSTTKKRYKSINSNPKGSGDKGASSITGGRKSGKGRKKNK